MMQWPLPQEFNEAVQNPGAAFSDPDLRAGLPVVGPHGLPLPHSGNYADVYQFLGPDGRSWAVKCFTRPVSGLEERYAAVADALAAAALPFGVGFTFLADGVRVRGAWRPIVKMEWVEGRPLNQVVEENLGRPAVLSKLCGRWAKLCRRLREAGIAHADIQHGNVMLVPGSKPGSYGLKLVDYDGMYVPALAQSPSGEAGHPNFQHPERLNTRAYSADLDRFPHLVIATALTALAAGGPALWGRYDNGDNLLFCEADFKAPSTSRLMRELWGSGSPAVRALVGRLAVACGRPLAETPWLDEVAPDGEPAPLDVETEREAAGLLGLTESAPVVFDYPGPAAPTPAFVVEDEEPAPGPAVVEPPGEAPPEPEAAAPEPEPAYEQQYEPEPEPEPEYEEPEPERYRPRPRDWRPAARRQPGRRRNKQAVTVAAVLGVLFAAAAAVAGVLVVAVKRSELPPDDGPGTANLIQGPGPRPNGPGLRPNAPAPVLSGRNPIIPPSDPSGPGNPASPPRFASTEGTPISSPHSQKVLGLAGGRTAVGTRVVTADYTAGDPAQLWKMVPAVGEWVYLENVKSRLVMTVANGGTFDGSEVVIARRQQPASDSQLWKSVAVAGQPGTVKFVNRGSDKVFGIDAKLKTSGARILLWTDVNESPQWFTAGPPAGLPAREEKRSIPPAPTADVEIGALPRLKVRWERQKGGANPHLLAFTDDGKWVVVTAKARPEIGVFDAVTGKLVPRAFTGHARGNASPLSGTHRALGVAPLPGGEVLSIAAEQDAALVWDPGTLRVKREIDFPPIPDRHPWSFLQTSPDGKYFAAGATTRMDPGPARPAPPPVTVTEVATGKRVLSVPMNWGVARFTADSTRLVVAHDLTGRIEVYRLATGEREAEASAPVEDDDAVPIAVSPDGKHVAYVSNRRFKPGGAVAYVCDVATGRHVRTLPISRPDDLRTDFSPDGKWLAVVAKPDTAGQPFLFLVNTTTWAPVAAAPTGYTGIFAGDLGLRFSPDGTALGLPRPEGDTVVFDLPRGAAGGKAAWDHVRAFGGPAGKPAEVVDDVYRVTGFLETREAFDGPFECSLVARITGEKLRLYGPGGAEVTFSSAAKRPELVVRRPDAKGRPATSRAPMPALVPNNWYTFRWRMTATQVTVWIDGTPVFEETGSYDLSVKSAVKLSAIDQPIEVKSFTAKSVK